MSIKFVVKAVKWFDKINGNTYHTTRITRVRDKKVIASKFTYGYGEQYKQTAIEELIKNKWINTAYARREFIYERENGYPILWDCNYGLKRECINNSKI